MLVSKKSEVANGQILGLEVELQTILLDYISDEPVAEDFGHISWPEHRSSGLAAATVKFAPQLALFSTEIGHQVEIGNERLDVQQRRAVQHINPFDVQHVIVSGQQAHE